MSFAPFLFGPDPDRRKHHCFGGFPRARRSAIMRANLTTRREEPPVADPIIVTVEVPPTDSPDDVTRFVAELNRLLGPNADVRAELELDGAKRQMRLRRAPTVSPA